MGAPGKLGVDARFMERDNQSAKIWEVRPPQSIIDDCKDFVRKTGKPDEWRWHIHTKPEIGSPPPVILDPDISVPEKLRPSVGMAPCPLCSLHGPRYFFGMLGWWKGERALRVIGNECGHKFYGEGFEEAKREFKKKHSDDAAQNFLIANLMRVFDLRRFITTLQPRARARFPAQTLLGSYVSSD